MAGDRRATMGNLIAQRDIEKVFPADEYSAVGIAGTAGIADRDGPAVPGRARALREDRGRHAVARRQGQPAGHDDPRQPRRGAAGPGRRSRCSPGTTWTPTTRPRPGRIFSFDVTGGRYEETGYDAVGSGSLFAKRRAEEAATGPGSTATRRVRACVEALYDAADDDTATGGPDLIRRIFPVVMTATAEGTARLADDETATSPRRHRGRGDRPGGRRAAGGRSRARPQPSSTCDRGGPPP